MVHVRSLPMGPAGCVLILELVPWVLKSLSVQTSKLQFDFPIYHNAEHFRAIGLKIGTDNCIVSGQMPIDFGMATLNSRVIECKKVEITFGTVSPRQLQLSTWNLVCAHTRSLFSNTLIQLAVGMLYFLYWFCTYLWHLGCFTLPYGPHVCKSTSLLIQIHRELYLLINILVLPLASKLFIHCRNVKNLTKNC